MNGEAIYVCSVLVVAIALFVSDRVRLDVVALLVILALSISGVLTPREAVAGFGDTTVVLIAGLFVVGEALSRTGVASAVGAWLLRTAGTGAVALQVRLMLVVALLSAFMSSTGAVAIFIPIATGLARKTGVPVSRLLMPMAFAALLGGTLTLIGTPPNIVVEGALIDHGLQGFGFLGFTPIGLVLLTGGIIYLVTLGPRLLGTRADAEAPGGDERSMDELLEHYDLRGRFEILQVTGSSSLVGQSLKETDLRTQTDLAVVAVQRSRRLGGADVVAAEPDTVLRADDKLLVQTPVGWEDRDALEKRGLLLLGRRTLTRALENEIGVVEVVVAPRSSLRGQTARGAFFRTRHRLHVLGVQHGNEPVAGDPLAHELAMGDTLLLGGSWERIERLQAHAEDLLVLHVPREWRETSPAYRRAPLALAILAAMMTAMILNLLPAVIAVIAAAVALVAGGCVTMPQAYRAVSWKSLVLIAGMLPMGTALDKSGALAYLVDGLVGGLGGVGPLGLMAVLFLLTAVLSQVISNTATTVLLAPVAIAVAEGLGVSPQPLVMAVAMAASAAFVTPVASPVNTLVVGPGGYRFVDFVRVGLPLLALVMVLVLLVVPLVYKFY